MYIYVVVLIYLCMQMAAYTLAPWDGHTYITLRHVTLRYITYIHQCVAVQYNTIQHIDT